MPKHDYYPLAPVDVKVAFPYTDDGVPQSTPHVETITLSSLALTDYPTGFSGHASHSKILHTDCLAVYESASQTANSSTETTNLAKQMATDYYLWQIGRQDVEFAGIVPYDPEGFHDLEFDYNVDDVTTRVTRQPFNRLGLKHNHFGTEGGDATECCGGTYLVWNAGDTAYHTYNTYEQFYTSDVTYHTTVTNVNFNSTNVTFSSSTTVTFSSTVVFDSASTIKCVVYYAVDTDFPNGYTRSGDTITSDTLESIPSIDGGTVSLLDRILLDDAADATNSGIYKCTNLGSGFANWVLERTDDADTSAELKPGTTVSVIEGTTYGGTLWLHETDGVFTINSTSQVWTQIGAGGGSGDVTGPASSTDNSIVIYNGTTGKIIKNQTVITINATGQLVTTLATGNAPFVVSSTTLVSNLNVQYLNSLQSTAFALIDGSQAYTGKQEHFWINFTDTTELTISSGGITVTQSFHRVDTEGDASSDDLDTITGMVHGDFVIIHPENDARTVVIKHNTGNIQCVGGSDITLDDIFDFAILIHNGTTIMAMSGGGGVSGTHASTHASGAADEIDGDVIDIDWNPTNYTPATTPSEVTSVDELTAHLYGIDQALANSGGGDLWGCTRVSQKSSNYTAAAGDLIPVDISTGNVTITLPGTPSHGDKVFIVIDNATGSGTATYRCDVDENLNSFMGDDDTDPYDMFIVGESLMLIYLSHTDITDRWYVANFHRIPHKAFMNRTASQTVNNVTNVEINCDNELWDVGGISDSTSNNRIDIKRDGWYSLKFRISFTSITSGKEVWGSWSKNGNLVRWQCIQVSHGQGDLLLEYSTTEKLVDGDYLKPIAYHNHGGAKGTNTTYWPFMIVEEL